MTMRVDGGKELAATLRALPTATSRNIRRDALEAAAEPMVAVARRLAPHEPGPPDLRANIEFQHIKATTKTESRLTWGPLRGFYYGYYQEWGTTRHPAQPFMRPAFDQNRERSLALMVRSLWENIQSYVHSRAA